MVLSGIGYEQEERRMQVKAGKKGTWKDTPGSGKSLSATEYMDAWDHFCRLIDLTRLAPQGSKIAIIPCRRGKVYPMPQKMLRNMDGSIDFVYIGSNPLNI